MQGPEEIHQELEAIAENLNQIVEEAVESAGAHEVFATKAVQNIVFFGKSLATWDDELALFINDNPDQKLIKELYVKLANFIQVASHYYSVASTSAVIEQTGLTIKRIDLETALLAYYSANNLKQPPNTVIEKMVENYTKRISNMNSIAKVIRDFWKQKLVTLERVGKCLDSISINNATQMKYS